LEGSITLPETKARALLASQGARDGWLTYHVISSGHSGEGRGQPFETQGRPGVSGIDDTDKNNENPAGEENCGRKYLLPGFCRRTRDGAAVPGLGPRVVPLRVGWPLAAVRAPGRVPRGRGRRVPGRYFSYEERE